MRREDTIQQGGLILVVDDEPASRLLVQAALEQSDFTVIEAENGVQALAAFERHRPVLVILDVMMPEMDGFDACAAIRRLPGGEGTPILILTALDDLQSIHRAYDAGATDFASKPVNPVVLGHRIRYMLRGKRALDDLRRSEARLARAQRIAHVGYWERDLQSGELHWSSEVCDLFGVPPQTSAVAYERFLELLHPEDTALVARATDMALRGEGEYSVDFRIRLQDGTLRHMHDQAEIIRDEAGSPARMAGTTQDITWRKLAEERIRFLAYYDGLTQLPNRTLFTENLRMALASARRNERMVAILFIDLDRFKQFNDTLGHTAGDRLLQNVAQRLLNTLRRSDAVARGEALPTNHLVGRIGGDEFLVAATDITRGEDAAKIGRRILDALGQPLWLEGHEVVVTASIGISLYPHDGVDEETLLRNADLAMYHVKDGGRNACQFYNQSMNTLALQRLSLESGLRRALERDEFFLHFQPQGDVESGAIVGVEALIRWRHPERGPVLPAEFIPYAEDTNLILPIAEWVLHQACAQGRAWQAAGYAPVPVAVNVSGRQLWHGEIVKSVDRATKATGLDPRHLELEVTESVLIRGTEEVINALKELKARGVRISLDDFGTGYSSLSYLTRFPFDTLKIDQSFVRDLATDARAAAITAAIIAMARSLGILVVAEGVDTPDQVAFLLGRGCRVMQGSTFGKPGPAEEIGRRLAAQTARTTASRRSERPMPGEGTSSPSTATESSSREPGS